MLNDRFEDIAVIDILRSHVEEESINMVAQNAVEKADLPLTLIFLALCMHSCGGFYAVPSPSVNILGCVNFTLGPRMVC